MCRIGTILVVLGSQWLMNNDLTWWLSVRDDKEITDQQRRLGDVLYGAITLFEFGKTHQKIVSDRYKSKCKHGLKPYHQRLSHTLKLNGLKCAANYFTPYVETVRSKVRYKERRSGHKNKQWVEYGRRHQLIISPRLERMYNKYGPWGG